MKDKNINDILNDYLDSCRKYEIASLANNHRSVNKYHDRIVNSYLQLRELGKVKELEKLLQENDNGVRAWAATHLLTVNEALAKGVLKEIAKLSGVLGFDAEMTLKEWENGSLTLDYKTYTVKW